MLSYKIYAVQYARNLTMSFVILAPIVLQHINSNIEKKARFGARNEIYFLLLGYPRPKLFIERLGSPKSYWKNYTSFLLVGTKNVYWTVKVIRNMTCADTGSLRLVLQTEENRRRVINVDKRIPLIGTYCRL